MTSVDSGVETGNDSNDSSVTHESNVSANFNSPQGSNAGNNNAGSQFSNVEVGPSRPLGLPIASICPGLNTNADGQGTSKPSTSGPLVLHANAEPTKVLEFRIPPMYIEPLYGANGQLLSTTMEILKTSMLWSPQRAGSTYHRKMKLHAMQRKSKFRMKTWQEFQGPLDERKMRLAAATNNIELMRRLLTSGVYPNNHDEQGRSPLHLASSRGYTDVVRLLLEHGADPNQRDCLGNTPLHLAAVTSKIAVVTLLLKAGTDVLSSDQHGHNPLQLAQTKLRLLQSFKGSDMNKIKEEVHNVVGMLLAYLQRQKDAREQVEALSTFCSRLSLSNTSDEIQGDVRDLLANIDSLSLAS
ncbi:ankyrin repeat domain-containing protein 54-like [Neodiprion virginianus]|uniref:ankyrin repeat domain-containing protein 54-like n=1 Tax=Neodiprion virginianus TaxID=2961670 RepID=UPI001EE6C101|nr:ankyrin repeat domain-containing protein 54-like [Neodiprion virginianus]